MPRVEINHAIKNMFDEEIAKGVIKMGASFDVASADEIEMVTKYGADPSKLIYANTVKEVSHLKIAKECGIKWMTFDSIEEMHKIKKHCPDA